MRPLSPEESDLWARVASTIRPLYRERRSSADKGGEAPVAAEKEPKPAPGLQHHPSQRSSPRLVEKARPGTTLDGGWDRRLRSGAVEPDRVLDLHGMTLDSAWRAIDRALEQAIGRGDRLLLLITGHHRAGEPPVQRGRIRAAVHDWLAASRHAAGIAAVRGAHRRHGGGGSLYIVLRRGAGGR